MHIIAPIKGGEVGMHSQKQSQKWSVNYANLDFIHTALSLALLGKVVKNNSEPTPWPIIY